MLSVRTSLLALALHTRLLAPVQRALLALALHYVTAGAGAMYSTVFSFCPPRSFLSVPLGLSFFLSPLGLFFLSLSLFLSPRFFLSALPRFFLSDLVFFLSPSG